jgi:hypothetical protein
MALLVGAGAGQHELSKKRAVLLQFAPDHARNDERLGYFHDDSRDE